MISIRKRGLCLMLVLCTVFMALSGYPKPAKAAITYNNTFSATVNCYIHSNGKIRTTLSLDGFKNKTTRIQADVYIEKSILGIFWTRVDIGYTNNVWHDSTTNYSYSNWFDVQLNSTGTYRVTVTYTVSGTGGADDIIVLTDTTTY